MIQIALYCPEIPHNTGAIGRMCVGLDIKLHLIRPLGFALTDRFLKRAGLDYWQYLDVSIHDDWSAFRGSVQGRQLWLATTKGSLDIYQCRFGVDDVLVFGSESSGLPQAIHDEEREHRFKIPMPGQHARSLNLAQAAAVATYEAYRQIR